MDRKGGGIFQGCPSKIFCLIVPKISLGESFIVALVWGTEKVWRRGAEHQDFPSKKFCLTVPKTSVGESFTVALISGEEGGIKIFRRKFFVSQCRKFP